MQLCQTQYSTEQLLVIEAGRESAKKITVSPPPGLVYFNLLCDTNSLSFGVAQSGNSYCLKFAHS
jgi:hypothetical protein